MKLLIALLPIIFMIHDFEEIIMFKPWLASNREELKIRFPKMEQFMAKKRLFDLSTSAFAIAIMHEFILISAATVISLYINNYSLWFAAFMAYTIHLFVHIVQWISYQKYVPVIITSLLTMPYCIYTFIRFIKFTEISSEKLILWTIIGIIATVLSFIPAFFFANKFQNWENKKLKN